MPRPHPAALSLSRILLNILRVLNLITGGGLILALPATFIFDAQVLEFFSKRPPSIDSTWLLPILRIWILLTLPIIAAVHILLSRLLDVVATVRAGDPFVPENAVRLKTIAWCVLATQLFDLANGVMAASMNAAGSNIEWKFSMTGWVAVVLLFVLARVFEEGTRMRDDLGTMI